MNQTLNSSDVFRQSATLNDPRSYAGQLQGGPPPPPAFNWQSGEYDNNQKKENLMTRHLYIVYIIDKNDEQPVVVENQVAATPEEAKLASVKKNAERLPFDISSYHIETVPVASWQKP